MKEENQPMEMNVLKRLALDFGTDLRQGRLEIPEEFGQGYCTGYVFNEHIRMVIMNYELREPLVIENPDIDESRRMILFKFQHVVLGPVSTEKLLKATPSVLIMTSSMNTDAVIGIHSHMATINIEVDAGYLKGLLVSPGKSPVLQSLLHNTQPLLFEQMMHPSLQRIVDEMVSEPVDEKFVLFFQRIKAEELVCRLLMALDKRDEQQLYNLNGQDLLAIYKIKEQMLEHPEKPPVINELAVSAHMSPTKLKRLFRQIFGNSIFSYYQDFRMKEAARLLKEEKLSVSDAGYKVGFTNLSHFSRVFEAHNGMKPKQYSRS
jgi:AraC-like DNA-binding protein